MYPEDIVKPMREELTTLGFEELFQEKDVEKALAQKGTTLVVVNSICGCAAAITRPGIRLSLGQDKTPDHLLTVLLE